MSNLLRGSVGAATAMFVVGTLAAISSVINRYPLYGGQALRYALAAVVLAAVARANGLAFVRPTRRGCSCSRPWRPPGWCSSTCSSSRPPTTPARPWSARSSGPCR